MASNSPITELEGEEFANLLWLPSGSQLHSRFKARMVWVLGESLQILAIP
jgi:hypothetical protein